METVLTRYADVRAALADPRFIPPPAEPGGPIGTLAWLRSAVARFSSGADHARRRALVTAALADVDPGALRRAATGLARADLGLVASQIRANQQDNSKIDEVPVRVLAEAMGVRGDGVAECVRAIGAGYLSGTASAEADSAVAELVSLVGAAGEEVVANRIGLLVQAHAATAGLVRNTVAAAARVGGGFAVEALLVETLRHDPPVRLTRRRATAAVPVGAVTVEAGATVRLDLAAANRDPDVYDEPDRFDPARQGPDCLTFGGPPRVCPGRDHAMAIAAGIVEAVLR